MYGNAPETLEWDDVEADEIEIFDDDADESVEQQPAGLATQGIRRVVRARPDAAARAALHSRQSGLPASDSDRRVRRQPVGLRDLVVQSRRGHPGQSPGQGVDHLHVAVDRDDDAAP